MTVLQVTGFFKTQLYIWKIIQCYSFGAFHWPPERSLTSQGPPNIDFLLSFSVLKKLSDRLQILGSLGKGFLELKKAVIFNTLDYFFRFSSCMWFEGRPNNSTHPGCIANINIIKLNTKETDDLLTPGNRPVKLQVSTTPCPGTFFHPNGS